MITWGPQVMPRTYACDQQRYVTFKRLYWNQNQHRIMWQRVENQRKAPVVLLSIPKATGTSYHRVQQPVRKIVGKYPNSYVFVYAQPATIADRMKCDILQLHRCCPQHDAILEHLSKLNPAVKKPVVINNIDDLQYQIPPTHYLYKQWMQMGKDKMSKRMFRQCDYNLITSWNYQKIIQRDIGYNVIKGKTYRFPNWIDTQLPQWCHRNDKKRNKKIRIGWIGLISHNVDLIYIHNIWKPLAKKYGDKVQFAVVAPMPLRIQYRDEQRGIAFTRPRTQRDGVFGFKKFAMQLFADIKQSKVQFLNALPLSQYGKLYRDLDISFIVVQPTKFNKAKSQIKITESVINRCIPVYNCFGPYAQWDQKFRDYVKHKYNNDPQGIQVRKFLGFCSHNIHDVNIVNSWVRSMSQVIDRWQEPRFNQAKQKFMRVAYQFNMNQYGLAQNISKRKRFYDMVCQQHKITKHR